MRLLPTTDVAASGWSSLSGSTSVAAAVVAGHTVHRQSRMVENRRWIFIGADDMRWDDIDGPVFDGPSIPADRAGQVVMQALHDELIDKGTKYNQHRTGAGPCWPARCEWQTGLYPANHGMNAPSSGASIANYTNVFINGHKSTASTLGRTTAQWMGPWGKDLAFQAGYTRHRVSHAQQTTDGVLRDSDDDLQAFTGSIYQQLAAEDVHVAFLGKESNGKKSTDPIHAGIEYVRLELETIGGEDQYTINVQSYDTPGGNAFDGNGVTLSYAAWTYGSAGISSITTSSGKGRIQCAAAHNLSVGEEVTIFSNSNGWDGTYVVTDVDSATIARFANPPAVSDGGGGTAWNRSKYAPILYATWAQEFMDGLDDADPFFINITSRICHDNSGSYTSTNEKKYEASIVAADCAFWKGVAGAFSPVSDDPNPTEDNTWQARQQMLASLDDMIRLLVDYCTDRWGEDGFGIVFTSDQGIQNGEQDPTWANGDIKTAVWEGSTRSPLIWRSPDFAQGVEVDDQPTMHADLPLTFLDLYGFTDHHWHTTRDGRSLVRLADSGDIARNRAVPVYGDYKTSTTKGFVWGRTGSQPNGTKYTVGTTASTGKTWNSLADGSADEYESVQHDVASGSQSSYFSFRDQLWAARFDPSDDTNDCHTLTGP